MNQKEDIEYLLKTIPHKPGVYRFYSKRKRLLYVGKAKNLKKRVNSYFQKKHKNFRLNNLVKQIVFIEYTVVEDENAALLLERNLIRHEQPKYNIQYKDDKSFPSIIIRNEEIPRIEFIRQKNIEDAEYFGPYTSIYYAKKAFETIKKLFQIRTCTYILNNKNIESKKFKVCLEYHIGNCLGPCEGHQSKEDYDKNVEQVRNILKGKSNLALDYLVKKQNEMVSKLEYEKAHEYKKRILALTQYGEKTTVVNTNIKHVDFYNILSSDKIHFITFIKIKNGAIVSTSNFKIKDELQQTAKEVLSYFIENHRLDLKDNAAHEIVIPFKVELKNTKITVPSSGDKKKVLSIAFRNLISQKNQYIILKKKHANKEKNEERVMKQMQKDLQLKNLPKYIECFDNSNIQGHEAVASMVVFRNTKASKKEYRKYNIKTVNGINDFASMTEVVYRRYSRLLREQKLLPNLIVIDGGKGQLSAARKALKKLNIENKITIIGIAKKLEEIYYPEDSLPLYINKKSETLKIIQQIRNEAHRFAITFHRKKRSKSQIKSELDNIKGVGEKTKERLIKEFGSVEIIKRASFEELALFIGKSKTKLVLEYFKN